MASFDRHAYHHEQPAMYEADITANMPAVLSGADSYPGSLVRRGGSLTSQSTGSLARAGRSLTVQAGGPGPPGSPGSPGGGNAAAAAAAAAATAAAAEQQDGYGSFTASVFLTSVAIGANLLNVPQATAHLGWLSVPMLAVLAAQSWFCSHLLSCSWLIVERLEPTLAGPVHKPYPLMAGLALGDWARYMTSAIVLAVDTLTAVMLMVLASDLVTSIISYAYPRAEPTLCLMIIVMAIFLCPFTWFRSPKKFWVIGLFGMTTSLMAWLLMLMKLCADYCKRATPPARLPPSPMQMMVGMSGICNSFTTGGVQPTIQADMQRRAGFSAAIAYAWLVISLVVFTFSITSYVLIGSEAKSSVLHSLEPGRLLLSIQTIMLMHVLTSFVIYINPLYQELEECINIDEGSWQQYTFRTLSMGLLLLISEALPDFGNVLDIISVLAIMTTLVLPPILYLRLTSRADVEITLDAIEKGFLGCLIAAGVAYTLVAACGTTAFVFAEQKQGTCFSSAHQSDVDMTASTTSTTPASRAVFFKAQILTFRPRPR